MSTLRHTKRQKTAVATAIIAVTNGSSIRKAAVSCRLAKTTFHRLYKNGLENAPKTRPGHTAFTCEEEESVVSLLSSFSARGYPLSEEDLLDAFEVLVTSFDPERRNRLQFRNGRPGRRFARNFRKRHANKLRFGRASKGEAKRFAATNADNLTSFFAAIEKVMSDNSIDEDRLCNLDECGISAETDKVGRCRKKVYTLRSSRPQQQLPGLKTSIA